MTIPYSLFLSELQKEEEYLSQSTPYRYKTAQMAAETAKKFSCIDLFLDEQEVRKTVLSVFPEADEERVKDVTKMLRVIARDLQIKSSLSNEAKEYIARKRKPFSLKNKLTR